MKMAPWTLFSVVMFLSLSLPAWAQDFYVIAVGRKLKNVVTVAKSGGQYTDVKTAIDSIGNASPDNPYLVYIGPGVYTVTSQIQLKAHVTVMGSGRKATLLRGTISSDDVSSSAIILGADNATLTQLSVENTGGSNHYSVGIYNSQGSPVQDKIAVNVSGARCNYGICNSSSSPTMTNVTATGSGGSYGIGVQNSFQSSPIMTNVTATGSGDTENFGVRNGGSSSPTMTNVTATGSGGTSNCGVFNEGSSSPTMTNVTATGSGDTYNYGVYNSSSSPTMTNVTATGSGGTPNCGVFNEGSSSPTIRNCTLKGTSYSLHTNSPSSPIIHNSLFDGSIGGSGNIYIAYSRLNGGMGGSLTYHCIGNYGCNFQPVNCP